MSKRAIQILSSCSDMYKAKATKKAKPAVKYKQYTRLILSFIYPCLLMDEENHWSLVCVDFEKKSITYYDSLGNRNFVCLKQILQYLMFEHFDKKLVEFLPSGWTLTNMGRHCPQQSNLWDCGVFVCVFAEYLARDEKFDFSQKDMPRFRKQIKSEIINKKLRIDMPQA
ncbi:Hypothetical protein CINCED_3A007028 [Cinara cedri]|uniref:Ubiquitin-like protease family profile domain-containing protein n=2 Tax=Cinara cedri TaxID=506608 RepID=A0A5E4MKR6_9HEMI|nr:Hypothetical protein CINCED_3A007028 [Cinara cedri]